MTEHCEFCELRYLSVWFANASAFQASKQWHDCEHSQHTYVKRAREKEVRFTYTSDFDENGIVYWIGTNAR